MRRNPGLLLVCALWWGVALAVVSVHTDPVLRSLVGLPLIFVLPGLAALSALRIRFEPVKQVVAIVGFSISITVLSGLPLDALGWLTPIGWAKWLGGFAVLCAGIALARQPVTAAPGWPRPPFRVRHAVLVGASLVVLAGVVLLGLKDEHAYLPFPFTDFWMIADVPGGNLYTIGIKNGERRAESFSLRVLVDGATIASWKEIMVAPQQTYTMAVTLPMAGHKAEAWLMPSDHPETVYHKVFVALPGWSRTSAGHDNGQFQKIQARLDDRSAP